LAWSTLSAWTDVTVVRWRSSICSLSVGPGRNSCWARSGNAVPKEWINVYFYRGRELHDPHSLFQPSDNTRMLTSRSPPPATGPVSLPRTRPRRGDARAPIADRQPVRAYGFLKTS
jgi:hypothetical protein